jgi:hypothetical protein
VSELPRAATTARFNAAVTHPTFNWTIRAALERAGTPIGAYDVLVAAQGAPSRRASCDRERMRIRPGAPTEV